MSNNNQVGKAAIIKKDEFTAIRSNFKSAKYRLMWDIAWYTGQGWQEILHLSIADVWDEQGLRESIRFRSVEIPIHSELRQSLEVYGKPSGYWLFPNRDETKPISYRAVHGILKRALERAGLEDKGITAHSTTRSFIYNLYQKGTDTRIIKHLTGCRNLQDFQIELNTRLVGAIASL